MREAAPPHPTGTAPDVLSCREWEPNTVKQPGPGALILYGRTS